MKREIDSLIKRHHYYSLHCFEEFPELVNQFNPHLLTEDGPSATELRSPSPTGPTTGNSVIIVLRRVMSDIGLKSLLPRKAILRS
jgi:hypothetical protein